MKETNEKIINEEFTDKQYEAYLERQKSMKYKTRACKDKDGNVINTLDFLLHGANILEKSVKIFYKMDLKKRLNLHAVCVTIV